MSEHVLSPRTSFAEYCALPGKNASVLKYAKISGLAYRCAVDRRFGDRPDTDPMRLGRAGHTLVLEPETYDDLYVTWPDRRGTKAHKAFTALHPGKTQLTERQTEYAREIAASVRRHELATYYLDGAHYEQNLVWIDEPTNIVCKGRTDALNVRRHVIADLKVLSDISERAVQKQTFALGWAESMAHYGMGALASGIWVTFPQLVIIAVESKPPFDVGVFELDGDTVAYGCETMRELLDKVKRWTDADEYPGRYPEVMRIEKPRWMDFESEEEGATEGLIFGANNNEDEEEAE